MDCTDSKILELNFNDEKSSRQRKLNQLSIQKTKIDTGRLLAALRQRLAGLHRPLLEQCLGEEAKG